MTVGDLIKCLSEYDKDAKVLMFDVYKNQFSTNIKVDYDYAKYFVASKEGAEHDSIVVVLTLLF